MLNRFISPPGVTDLNDGWYWSVRHRPGHRATLIRNNLGCQPGIKKVKKSRKNISLIISQ